MTNTDTAMTGADAVVPVTDADFAAVVLDSELPVLVDFFAEQCGPCRMLVPVLAEIATEEAGRIRIVKIDVGANPGVQATYGIMSTPTLMVFRGGQPVKTMVGARAKRRLLSDLAGVI
ncbi:thioredoxin [Nocardia sp. NPDC005978]|uniref:thioredoxin n=1 Tax=unclassified Nocardia TaxID=2637762 RepID=UPI0033A1FF55